MIRPLGPPSLYWEWFVERFCGRLVKIVHSQRSPWVTIDTYLIVQAQIQVVCLRFNLSSDVLNPRPFPGHSDTEFEDPTHCTMTFCSFSAVTFLTPGFPDPLNTLMPPRRDLELSPTELSALANCLQKTTSKPIRDCRAVLPTTLTHFAKLRINSGGDTIHARDLVSVTDISRDALYVQVSSFAAVYDLSSNAYAV
jgi:hypothetical protein